MGTSPSTLFQGRGQLLSHLLRCAVWPEGWWMEGWLAPAPVGLEGAHLMDAKHYQPPKYSRG